MQSPYEAAESIAHLLGEARAPFKPARINAQFAYVGGGFGGRDHTPFVLYVALAAMFFPGRPVRLAHDRYQQFQGGIKRHAFKMRSRIGVDRATGKIRAFAADHVLDGGGLANFSASVATVGADRRDRHLRHSEGRRHHGRAAFARRHRGIDARLRHAADDDGAGSADRRSGGGACRSTRSSSGGAMRSRPSGRTMTGNPYSVSVRTPEILDKLEKHPIWQQRAQEKAARAQRHARRHRRRLRHQGLRHRRRLFARARRDRSPDGRISIYCDHVEMGNGIGTALANRVAVHLGGVADEVSVARVDSYDALGLVTSGDPYTMDQKTQDAAEKNPRWVPAISSATSASIGAHVGTHAAAEAARVIFRFGLWPAALELWRIAPNDPRAKDWAKAQLEGRAARHAGPCRRWRCRRSPRPRMRATS